MTDIHYFDHATTSRPKAPGVAAATADFYRDICASPSRSGHRLGAAANNVVTTARAAACEYFCARSPGHIVFTSGATAGLNLVIRSLLRPGDEVVLSSLDHNSVIRPAARLREVGVIVTTVSGGQDLPDFINRFVSSFSRRTRLAVVTQASNVDGTVLPAREIAVRAQERGIPVLIDGAQSVGWLPREQLCCGADYFAASLHKGLLGPFGLGVLVVGSDDAILQPLYDGGTGLESGNPAPQGVIPNGLETGTMNIAGVAAAIPAFAYARSPEAQTARENAVGLFGRALDALASLENIRTFAPVSQPVAVPILSAQHRRLNANDFARVLDEDYGILTRAGLHCAPLRHVDLGTYPDGTVRIAFGHSTTEADVEALVAALQKLDGVKT